MRLLLLLSLFSILLIAGCAQQGSGANQSANKTVEKMEPTTVKVGVLLPLTGSLANIGAAMKDSAMMAAEDINKNGGINGKNVTLVIEDTSCDPAKAVPALNKMISQDKISALVGGTCSGESLAVASILTQNKLVTISPSATHADLTEKGGDYFFRIVASDYFQGKLAAQYAKEKMGAMKVGILYQNNDWAIGLKDGFSENIIELGGQVVAQESFESQTTDVRTQITKIKSANPDLIYVPCYSGECVVVLQQLSEAGYTGKVLGADGADDAEALKTIGEVADGFVITAPVGSETFNSKFNARYGKDAGAYTAQTYDTVILLSEGLKKGTDGQSIKPYLEDLLSYVGQSGIITFDEHGDITSAKYEIKEFKDGKFTVLEKV